MLKHRRYTLLDYIWLPLRATPVPTLLYIVRVIIQSFIPAVTALVTAQFVNTAISIAGGSAGMDKIVLPIAMIVFITSFNVLGKRLTDFCKVRIINGLRSKLRPDMLEKRARLEYACIEDPEKWDLVERVTAPKNQRTPEDRVFMGFADTLSFMYMIVSFISVISLIIAQVWWAGLLIIAAIVPVVITSMKGGNKTYEAQKLVSKEQRRHKYLHDVLAKRDNAAERAVFDFTGEVSKECREEYERARKIEFDEQRKWFFRMNLSGMIVAAVSAVCALVLLIPTIQGLITVGMFMGLFTAMSDMVGDMRWLLAQNTTNVVLNSKYAKDLTEFMAMPEQEGAELMPDRSVPAFERLEFKNVSFAYPGSDANVLNGLSFTLEKGRHYSFVGANGAGKTTITKLLLGMYQNYEGEILINGKELRTYSVAQLKALFICVFQDFSRYQLTMRENIELGNIGGTNNGNIERAVELSGLSKLKERIGFDAHIGKLDEDGVDVSGGEWQRIAMARAIISQSEIKILDEPTAALDPIAERDVYENFRDISRGNTTVFISHRLGSTKLADIIYVLDGGRVIESGDHEKLMEEDGLYAEMFESQRSWYAQTA